MQHNKQTSRHKGTGKRGAGQRGASMIELLVSILIFAFGMLGLVGLQNKTLGFGQISLFRSQATALSDDILDRMRADRANARLGNWDTTFAKPNGDYTGSTIAQTDLKEWKTQVETLLPSGQAQIERNGSIVTIRIRWAERNETTSFQTVSGL